MRRAVILATLLLLTGCSAHTAVRPVDVQNRVLQHPTVAEWYAAHSAPRVFADSPTLAKRWKKYLPSIIVDRSIDGFEVRLQSGFGPDPRQLIVVASDHNGEVLSVTTP